MNLLGNSIRGLDFLNWRRVYNTLIIPVLTYGAPVWYIGVKQQGLLKRLAITQNEGLCKIMGTFRTTLVEPLHNMIGIPPIPYLMKQLMLSYAHRLKELNLWAKVCMILTQDK